MFSLACFGRTPLAITVVSGFLAGWLTILQARGMSLIVDGIFLGGQTLRDVTALFQALCLAVLARAVLAWVGETSAMALAVRVKSELRSRVHASLLKRGPAGLGGEKTGELTAAAVEGIELLEAYFSQYLPQLAVAALVPVSILLFVLPLDPLSGLVLFLTAPLIPLFMVLIGKAAEILTGRQFETLGRLSAHFHDSLQGLTTLKLFGRSAERAASIDAASRQYTDVTLSVLRVTFLSALVLELIATLSTAVVAVEVGLRLLYARMQFRDAFFLLLLAPEFYLPLRMLGLRFHAGMTGTSAARRIFALLDAAPQAAQPAASEPPPSSFEEIRFERVGLTYPQGGLAALDSIDLTIRRGEQIAIVGPSGAGKSTLAALLLRFLEPSAGRILVDGRPLAGIDPDAWRETIAWVPQAPYLFHGTLAENLRLARPQATADELAAALAAAGLEDFVASLPHGLETAIGEQGARLSGGQAQRLALARAHLKQAPILILDEPTSSLDPALEARVEAATRRLMRGRTVITIAHRLRTVENADRILVLKAGRLVESGSPRELRAAGGVYAALLAGHAQGGSDLEAEPSVEAPPEAEERAPFPARPDLETGAGRQVLPRLLAFLRGSRGWVLLSVLLGALTVGSNIGLLGTSAYLISAAALHPSIAVLQVSIVGVRFFGLSRAVFRYLERLTSHRVTFELLGRLRGWYYRALEPLVPARLLRYRGGDLLGRVLADVQALENFYVRAVAPPQVALLVTAGTTLFLSAYDGRIALVYLGFAVLLGFGLSLASAWLARSAGRQLTDRRTRLHAGIVDLLLGMADLLAFGRARAYAAELDREGEAYGSLQRRMAALSGLQSALSLLLTNAALLAVLGLSAGLVERGRLPGVLLGVLPLIVLASFEALVPLPQAGQSLAASLRSAQRLFEVVDEPPAVSDRPGVTPGASLPERVHLKVDSLTFTHPAGSIPALQEVSFELPPGKRLAVVGASGSGKSTLANLLLRFLEPASGRIEWNGREVHALPQEEVRAAIAACLQRSHFFDASLLENIRIASPQADPQAVAAAARLAGIDDLIRTLPAGYETRLGERGLRLSGGERQRLALARALLRRAPILILDEPTANLDPAHERRILDALLRACAAEGGRSLLLITHRLVGLERMDEILVLQAGRVIERGTHAELLRRRGWYSRMLRLQEGRLA